MKHTSFLLFILFSWSGFNVSGQTPTQTAKNYVRPYPEAFQYGSNLGYYTNAWNDEALAGLVQGVGGHSIRPKLPESFMEQYGYSIRANTFNAYVNTLGMKELTCFVESPSAAHRDMTTYPGGTGPSKLFAHLYEPIWNADGNVNANNYYAIYLYRLLLTYGDKVRFWEVVNEPDFTYAGNINEWLTRAPQPGELPNLQAPIFHYIRMLRISYEVVKKYRPEAYVAPGGVGYAPFVDALLRYTDNPNGGAVTAAYPHTGGAYLDALSFHSYPAYSLHYWDNASGSMRYTRTSDYAAGQVIKDKQAMTDVLARYGYNGTTYPAKQLLMSETNISRRTSDNRTGSDEMQRNFGIKTLVLAQKNSIRQLYIYSVGEAVNAPAPGQWVSGADEISLMGLYENLTRDTPGSQKTTQLGQGFATTSKLLYGSYYDAARTAGLALPGNIEGAAFSKNGSYTYVLWAKALTDNSEYASATYSFPTAWRLGTLQRSEWNCAATGAQTAQPAQNIPLSGTPSFFSGGTAPVAPGPGTGTILREQWNDVAGSTLAAIPLTTPPADSGPITQFEVSSQTTYRYATRLRGYVCPPQSGPYTFWIVGDDTAQLFLSSDDTPGNKASIATCATWTASSRDWFRSPTQQSAPVQLQAGRRYYIEALHKQEWGLGYVAVACQRPDGTRQEPMSGSILMPFVPSATQNVTATPAAPTATTGSKVRITVTFATAPASATARLAPTLYNKARVLHFEEDDSPVQAYTDAYPLLHGGVASTGQVCPGLRFSDGCGHSRAYTAAVALNGHNTYNNTVWLDPGPQHDPGRLVWEQAQTLLDRGWDVENHSDLHTGDNPAQQLTALDVLIANRLRGYRPSVCIVPTNYAGYPTAAFAAGYLAVSSTGQGDQFPMVNLYSDDRIPLSSLPAPTVPFVYRRYSADAAPGETAAQTLARLRSVSDALLAAGPAGEVYVQRVFAHGIDFGVLSGWLTYTQAQAQDRLWVTTLREFGEYRRVSREVVKTETLSGTTLTVDLDYAAVSPDTRFQNLTLLVDSPGTIATIAVTGADSSSFNKATKMVNVFRRQAATPLATRSAAAATANGKKTAAEKIALSIYPNPFSSRATVQFSVPQSGPVTLGLYDLRGRFIRQLYSGMAQAGTQRNISLEVPGLSMGLYLVRLVTDKKVITQQLSCTAE